MPRLLLVRHGESEWNAIGRWQGRADPLLSRLGAEQARLAAMKLGTVDGIVASSLQRAHQTASILSEALGVGPIYIEPDLVERDAGEWQGLTRVQIEAEYPGYLASGHRPPSYELDPPLLERVRIGLHRIATEEPGDELIVVTHGGVINALEADFGHEWKRVPNLGGRWFDVSRDTIEIGDRIELVDAEHATTQAPGQL